MPLYEYRCQKCGKSVELLRKFEEKEAEVICSDDLCKGEARSVLSRSSFVLKGGGWASDGYSSR